MNSHEGIEQPIGIRETRPSDAEGITHVLYEAWLTTYPNEELGITREDIEERYKDAFTPERIQLMRDTIARTPDNLKRLTATHGEQITGTLTIIRNKEYNELRTIYVLPEFQGQGVGAKLWAEAEPFCDPTKDTIVHVATYNANAINFYKKLGFVETDKHWSDPKWKMKSGATIPEMEMVRKAPSTDSKPRN